MGQEPEHRIEVETPFGPIWFWGRDTGLPVLVLITGTFAEFDVLDGLDEALLGVDVWRAHLPGNHCPPLVATSIGVFARAFSHAVKARLADRPVAVCGLSVGELVALGLRAPNLKRYIAVEPMVLTEGLWMLNLVAAQAPPGSEDFLWNILGASTDRIEPRDYTALLHDLPAPAVVLIGETPAGSDRTTFEVQPSMITDAARAALAACGQVRIIMAPGAGHNVPKRARMLFFEAVLASCQAAFGAQAVRPRIRKAATGG